jgi:hypothetical protein
MTRKTIGRQAGVVSSTRCFSFLVLFWSINYIFLKIGLRQPQCCDADWYKRESDLIVTNGFLPENGETWLSTVHNFFYPVFLHFLQLLGIDTRIEIAHAQFVLLLLFSSSFLVFLEKVSGSFSTLLYFIYLGLTCFLSLNFIGFTLTEGLSSSLIIGLVSILYLKTKGYISDKWILLCNYTLIVLSSLLWTIRPSFLWLPFVIILSITLEQLILNSAKKLAALKNLLISMSLTFFIMIPQIVFSRRENLLDSLFHFSDLRAQSYLLSGAVRYSTNLSGCGPAQLTFSPYAQDFAELASATPLDNIFTRLALFVARVVSGWDAFPSNFVYMTDFGNTLSLLITLISGYVFIAPVLLFVNTLKSNVPLENRTRNFLLILIFIASQVSMGLTHGEFRYNIIGWSIGFIAIMVLVSNSDEFKLKIFLIFGTLATFMMITIGQITLLFSAYWIECVR